jgi:ABC-2 type transport system permease protein
MSTMTVLLRKDLKDIFKSKTTYTYLIVPIMLSLPYIENANALVNALVRSNASAGEMQAGAQAMMDSVFSGLPLIIIMLVCSVLASYAVILDKTKRTIESLMATPLSLRQIWLAKSLAVTIPAYVIGLVMTVLVTAVINFVSFVPHVGIIIPGVISIVTAVVLVPILTLVVVGIVTCLQLIITNPRLASLIFSLLFLLIFFPSVASQIGLRLDYSIIYLIIIAVLLVVNGFLSRFLTKERIILSSKT